ncbi:MAG: hypothetical protein JNM17_12680 [Archangium sp.]|nr:hypothetical protein [Archangium sp.]
MRSTFWSRLALALLSVLGVFVPLVETNTRDEVTIDGTRRLRDVETPAHASLISVERSSTAKTTDAFAPAAPNVATQKRFLLHRAWLN